MKIPVFLSTTILCPKCGRMIEKLPPGMEEAISDGDKLSCVHCQSELTIHIELPDRARLTPDEAASQALELLRHLKKVNAEYPSIHLGTLMAEIDAVLESA